MDKIIVTGCNGQLGRAINKELEGKYEIVNTDVFEGAGITPLDITNVDDVIRLAREVKPYAIVNCAAYTAVDAQEKDVDLAYKINAIARAFSHLEKQSFDDINEMCDFGPIGRFLEPSEIADLFCFLASDEARAINGIDVIIDGGKTLGKT